MLPSPRVPLLPRLPLVYYFPMSQHTLARLLGAPSTTCG